MIEVPLPILKSAFRKEIDEMLSNGDSYSAISRWLDNQGEKVTRQTISQYHKFCFNINKAAAEVYQEAQAESDERLHKAAVEQSNTLKLYDKFISAAAEIDPSRLDERTVVEIAVKMAKQREDFMREHGDSAVEEMTKEIEDLRSQIKEMNLLEVIRGMSDDRTRKRIKASNNS